MQSLDLELFSGSENPVTTQNLIPEEAPSMKRLTQFFALAILSATVVSLAAQAPQPKPPTTLRGVLLEQLKTTHNAQDWFASGNTAIHGITAEQAGWTDGKGNHSVGQLAYHLVFWNENALARLRGETPKGPNSNDATFNDFDAAHWTDIVQRLDRVMKALETEVEKMPEEKLAEVANTISHISTHNAYHTGQILYVRKLQGSWNPENGVK